MLKILTKNNRMKLFTALTILLFNIVFVKAQVSCTPVFPGPDDDVTITFNANEGSRGLATETGDIYAHTGLITDKSTSASDWKYVKFPWTTNDASVKLTPQGNGIYTLKIPKIRQFYGVPSTDKILKLAFVFRNSNGSKEGKTANGGDIFYDLVTNSDVMLVRLTTPTESLLIVAKDQLINVKASASLVGTLTLMDNGTVVKTLENAKELAADITASGTGAHTVKFKAVSGDKADSVQFTYFIQGQVPVANPPSGVLLGANLNTSEDSLTLLFQAPNKQNVFVIGSFNDYQINDKYLMNRSEDGKTWWLKIGGLQKGQTYTYQYLVDGKITVADPLSTLILDQANDGNIPTTSYPNRPAYPSGKTTGHVSVIQTGKMPYVWKVNNFQRPAKSDLVIYELLIRDFSAARNYQTLIDTLPYLKRLNINAIELMPINEYENNESWGYNPSYHMALDKYYGSADKFKEFVDKCHENGIAVILDVVFNHAFGQSPLSRLYFDGSAPAENNPWLNRTAKHDFNVGYDMNHESEYTKAYVERCLKYWLIEFKVDGYRFDLSKGFTQNNTLGNSNAMAQYDQSRINILKNYHNVVQQTAPGAYSIMEHFAQNSEETALAEAGMMLWGNMNYNYNESTMGWEPPKNDLGGVSSHSRGWITAATADKLIGYMESHDEERLMVKNILYGNSSGNYNVKSLATALKRMELASSFFYTVPGPKMLWQFGELGYDVSIDEPGTANCRVCNKPVRWNYLTDPNRKRLYDVTRNLIYLKTQYPAFRTLSYDHTELNTGYLKAFHINDASMNATILGNFNVVAGDISPKFQSTGKWYEYMTGDSINVADVNTNIRLLPGEYRIYTNKKLPIPPAGFIRFTTSTDEFAALVNDFQVYPNPSVDGRIFIGYQLKKGGEVAIEVMNSLGQIIFVNSRQKRGSGSYQETLNMDLKAGIYFIKLKVGEAFDIKKVVMN
jgi:1,4-alpha-glucan branching enzyme